MKAWGILALVLAASCGGDDSAPEVDAAPSAECTADAECDDGIYCNGAERCEVDACVSGVPPCSDDCDEGSDSCLGECPDRDGDGSRDVACGGDDCDDADANRYPGNIETCDSVHDEDCDPQTLGDRDRDNDGSIDQACCNNGICGDDCDDSDPMVLPGASEICDNEDNDCDSNIDEDPTLVTWCIDADGDLFGDPDGDTQESCAPIDGFSRVCSDCNDGNASINPGARELTGNGQDDDCDDALDEGLSGYHGIFSLGGVVSSGALRLSRTRLEGWTRVCGSTLCVTGGVGP